MSHKLSLTIANDLAELGRVNEMVQAFAEPYELSPQARFALDLALEELLSNVIQYAYDDREPHEIVLTIAMADDELVIRIEDDGREFDPLAAPKPDTQADIEDRQIGGLGIHLVRNVVHSMTYKRVDGKNALEVRIKRGMS